MRLNIIHRAAVKAAIRLSRAKCLGAAAAERARADGDARRARLRLKGGVEQAVGADAADDELVRARARHIVGEAVVATAIVTVLRHAPRCGR